MSNINHINDKNFEKEVLQSDIPVLIELSANWCVPCKQQISIIEQLSNSDLGKKIKIVLVDTDECPEICQKLNVRGVPNIILFNKGELIGSLRGLSSLQKIQELLNKIGL